MKVPGPDHPITTAPETQRVTVKAGGEIIATSQNALVMHEARHDAVYYIPRSDVQMDRLEPTDHQTHCPYKGDANYFSIRTSDGTIENAVWSYEAPFPAVADIKDHLAFYVAKIDEISLSDS